MKPKIKHKLMAALVAAISLFCLAITASAGIWDGLSGGATSDGGFRLTSTPFGYIKTDPMAWRVDLYISANEDGKIKESDSIGHELALVGSILCTTSGFTSHYGTTYIQTNYTNESRNQGFSSTGRTTSGAGEDIGGVTYTLPTLKKFDPYQDYYEDASGHKVAIADSGKITLFDGQYKVPTSFQTVQEALTKDEAKANQYTSEIIQQLREKDKSTKGEQGFMNKTLQGVNSKIKAEIGTRPEAANPEEAFNKYILPNGEAPMVEWALVITPMIHFHSDTAFYCAKDSVASLKHDGCALPYVSNHDYIALDAYWFAQSDVTSISLGKDGWYQGQTYNNSAMHINPNTGKEIGLLSRFLRDTSGAGKHYASAVASAAYSTETSSDPYLIIFFCL